MIICVCVCERIVIYMYMVGVMVKATQVLYIRVLKAVAALVTAEELVREAHVAAHATHSLGVHHCLKIENMKEKRKIKKERER